MPVIINTNALEILVAMGLPRNRSIRALYAVGGLSIDRALDWLYEHMDDTDIDDPVDPILIIITNASPSK